jgi:two-component system response regulator HydG
MGQSVRGFTPQAMDRLVSYDWPGNIRELENMVERAMNLVQGDWITERELAPDVFRMDGAETGEEHTIREVLSHARGNVSKAAALSGIPKRTLYRRIEEYAIDLSEFRRARGGVR